MNAEGADFERALRGLPLGGLRYLESTGSTNLDAAQWVQAGAPDLALVVAGEQTAGRGRLGRRWLTPPGSALAFSLVLRLAESLTPRATAPATVTRYTALGALAVCWALETQYDLQPAIKWPNDVLLAQRKLCGVLAEAHWQGERLAAVILGVGVNVTPASVPLDEQLAFPATCVQTHTARPVERPALLAGIMEHLLDWRPRLASPEFLQAWEERLAFRGQWVTLHSDQGSMRRVQVLGLQADGALRVRSKDGQVQALYSGELSLRPQTGSQETSA